MPKRTASTRAKKARVIPGFGLTLGFSLAYLSVLVLIPFAALGLKASGVGWAGFWDILTDARVQAAFRVSFGTAFVAAAINAVFGLLVTWVLVRYRFPGRKIVDALVDLPFALPTAVAGIALTTLYAQNGPVGGLFAPLGLKIAFTPLGIIVALTFVGLPFVVRTVQPVLQDLEREVEEASASLGADRLQTFFKIILPTLFPPLLTGFALAFARAVGEYGSVVFISGNMPMKTEIVPLLIVSKLEQYDYAGATAIAVLMLFASFTLLLLVNVLSSWSQQRTLPR